jgi:hypothetical protein
MAVRRPQHWRGDEHHADDHQRATGQ